MDLILIALVAYCVGAVLRTVYDYLFKFLDDPDLTFSPKYFATMIIGIILSFISAMVTFSLVQVPQGATAYVVISCIAQGFMANHLVNKPVDYLSKRKG